MHQLRGWIFDLDGTLTLAQHDFVAIRRQLGVPAEADILGYMAGLPADERVQMQAELDAIERQLAADVAPAPGAAELIDFLHARGDHLGILTRNLQQVARNSLAVIGVLDCFADEDILGRDEAAPKPAPGGILQLLARWQQPPSAAVMLGDFRFDLEAGRAAGCHTCLIHPDNTWPALADWHMPDCQQLLAYLQSR